MLAIQNNYSSQEVEMFIASLFHLVEEPLSNALVPQSNPPPTTSEHCQFSFNEADDILQVCKKKYFKALYQQYELKSSGGITPINFLLKDDLNNGLKEAEAQAMDFWSSLDQTPPQIDDERKQNKKRLLKYISEVKSAVQTKNSSNHTLYAEKVRNQIRGDFKQLFKVKYQFLCSTPLKTLGKGKDSFQKFYDHENLKKIVSCMVSQVTKSCEQFTVKLNPLYEKELESDQIFVQLKKEADNWGNNLVDRNYKHMNTIQKYVNTSIISQFMSESRAEINKMLLKKQPSDLKWTQEQTQHILRERMNSCLVQIDEIYNEFAMDNRQQLLEEYNQVLEQKMTELHGDAIGRWRINCRNLLQTHHERMNGKISLKSQSTPQFVLDIYAKHLETAMQLAKIQVEENILGIQEEEPCDGAIALNFTPHSTTTTPPKTPSKNNNSDGRKSKHASPNTSISPAAANGYHDDLSEDDGQSPKRRRS